MFMSLRKCIAENFFDNFYSIRQQHYKRFISVTAMILLSLCFRDSVSQSKSDTTFLDKVQKIFEIRRSFEIESQAKNPALLSYKKTENSNASVTVDLAVTYLGLKFDRGYVKPFVQIDFSGSTPKDKNELLTTGLSTNIILVDHVSEEFKIHPDIFYTRDFYSKLNIYRIALTFVPEIRNFLVPIVDYTKKKFSEESIDGKWLFGLNPNASVKLKETDFDGDEKNVTSYFGSLSADIALRKWYFQLVMSGLGERVFGDLDELRYEYGATATVYFDEKERSSLNARFQQKGSDLKQAVRSFTLGLGLKL